MHGFFKRFLLKEDKKPTRQKILSDVDEVDVCVINVDTLRCPICMTVYQSCPQTLQCGHSFCRPCIKEVFGHTFVTDPEDVHKLSLYCPCCRKKGLWTKVINNYAMKSILESVNEISRQEVENRKAFDNTICVSNEQLRAKCNDMERTADKLRKEINSMRQKEKYNYVAISFFIIVYIILSTLFGN